MSSNNINILETGYTVYISSSLHINKLPHLNNKYGYVIEMLTINDTTTIAKIFSFDDYIVHYINSDYIFRLKENINDVIPFINESNPFKYYSDNTLIREDDGQLICISTDKNKKKVFLCSGLN
jgi:hypothetical protein